MQPRPFPLLRKLYRQHSHSWNSCSAEKRTLPLALLDFQGEFLTNYPLLFTGVLVASTPLVVAYVFLQRYFVAGLTAGSVRG